MIHQRNVFPNIKPETDIHYHTCLVLHPGVKIVIQIAKKCGIVVDTLQVPLDGATNSET